jgi:hypothetical protein
MKRRKLAVALFALVFALAGAGLASVPGCSITPAGVATSQPGLNTAKAVLAARETYQLVMSQLVLLRQQGQIDDNTALAIDAVHTVYLAALDRATAAVLAGKDVDATDAIAVLNDALAELTKYLVNAKEPKA